MGVPIPLRQTGGARGYLSQRRANRNAIQTTAQSVHVRQAGSFHLSNVRISVDHELPRN